MTYDVIVIGAGASGLMAAGRAAETGGKVLLIEKNDRSGRKLLITGKGRCNITNKASTSELLKQVHPNGRFLKHAFHVFSPDNMISFLSKLGLECELERGARFFPKSNRSIDVLNALIDYNRSWGVETWHSCRGKKLIIKDHAVEGLIVESGNKTETLSAPSVVIATGGLSYASTGSTGDGYILAKSAQHTLIPTRPALVPLETTGKTAQGMQGLSLKNVTASVWANGKKLDQEFGEMLFTHFGISGPIILSLSRLVVDQLQTGNKIELSIDLKPALDEKQLDKRLLRDANDQGKKKMANLFRQWLPQAMIPVFIDLTGVDPEKEAHQLNASERKKILYLMKNMKFGIRGYRPFKEAIITAGGVNTKEVDPRTMQSKIAKGLFFAGEVLDLDANTGGYNLQIAWSTGWLAGESAAIHALHHKDS